MKSRTVMICTLGKRAIISSFMKQKTNSRSSTEAKSNTTNDKIRKIILDEEIMDNQGFNTKLNVLYQDNKSMMALIKNDRLSSGKNEAF